MTIILQQPKFIKFDFMEIKPIGIAINDINDEYNMYEPFNDIYTEEYTFIDSSSIDGSEFDIIEWYIYDINVFDSDDNFGLMVFYENVIRAFKVETQLLLEDDYIQELYNLGYNQNEIIDKLSDELHHIMLVNWFWYIDKYVIQELFERYCEPINIID